jgi:hypothetical protein
MAVTDYFEYLHCSESKYQSPTRSQLEPLFTSQSTHLLLLSTTLLNERLGPPYRDQPITMQLTTLFASIALSSCRLCSICILSIIQ